MTDPARFIPVNRQEFENELATICGKHMGDLLGNPSAWVISAMRECYQAGFGLGFKAASQVEAKRAEAAKNQVVDRLYPSEAKAVDPEAWKQLKAPTTRIVPRPDDIDG